MLLRKAVLGRTARRRTLAALGALGRAVILAGPGPTLAGGAVAPAAVRTGPGDGRSGAELPCLLGNTLRLRRPVLSAAGAAQAALAMPASPRPSGTSSSRLAERCGLTAVAAVKEPGAAVTVGSGRPLAGTYGGCAPVPVGPSPAARLVVGTAAGVRQRAGRPSVERPKLVSATTPAMPIARACSRAGRALRTRPFALPSSSAG